MPKEISRDDATWLYQIIPNASKATKIAEKIIPLDQKLRKKYLQILAKNPKPSHLKILKKAKQGLLQQRVTVKLNKTNARKLQRLSLQHGLEITDMANKIVSSYLKKK